MIKIDNNIRQYITKQLQNLAVQHNIKILLAIESGSRAWGYPSQDSDYDVRFIYSYNIKDYLSVHTKRDVIETPIIYDEFLQTEMDMCGWDIRKTLQLGLKSNATIQEWLTSPIYYLSDEQSCNFLKQFVLETASISIYHRRYETLGKQAYKQLDKQSLVIRAKDYCYSIRASLALMWLDCYNQLPPMDMESLQQGLNLSQEIQTIISKIIEVKSKTDEKEKINTHPKLNELIEKTLEKKRVRLQESIQEDIQKANKIFYDIVLNNV